MPIAKGISKKSIEQAHNVMALINSKRIVKLHTQGAMYRVVECVKFPYTKEWVSAKEKGNRVNIYGGAQYDPIINYMISQGWIVEERVYVGKKYHYEFTVTEAGKKIVTFAPARSIKESIVEFVHSKNRAVHRKEIIEFLVDQKFGEGTYKLRGNNGWRGYYSCAFSAYNGNDYLYTGPMRLVQLGKGMYSAYIHR